MDKSLTTVWDKWANGILVYSDFRTGQQMQKNPPMFKKLLAAGSVEAEALESGLIHEKQR